MAKRTRRPDPDKPVIYCWIVEANAGTTDRVRMTKLVTDKVQHETWNETLGHHTTELESHRFDVNEQVGRLVETRAIAQDGTVLAGHQGYVENAKHEIGFRKSSGAVGVVGDHKREWFDKHYPDGYELEWVDDPDTHEGLQAALEAG